MAISSWQSWYVLVRVCMEPFSSMLQPRRSSPFARVEKRSLRCCVKHCPPPPGASSAVAVGTSGSVSCHQQDLVGGWATLLKNYEFVSYDIPNIWKVIKAMFQTINQRLKSGSPVHQISGEISADKKDLVISAGSPRRPCPLPSWTGQLLRLWCIFLITKSLAKYKSFILMNLHIS